MQLFNDFLLSLQCNALVNHQYSVHPVFQRVTLHKLFEKYRFIVFFLKILLTLQFHDVLKLEAKVIFLFHPTLRYLGGLPFNPLCG